MIDPSFGLPTIQKLWRLWTLTFGIGLATLPAINLFWPWSCEAAAQSRSVEPVPPLPDTEISVSGPFKAWLIQPTTRYNHAVLGDEVEAGGLVVEHARRRLVFTLPADAVFEDRRVRLADLDGDGIPEAIVVKAYLERGAAIAVYRILPDRIEPLAESPAIGIRNRWLNPVGIADFTGTGEPMIAAVITPHLAGSLRLYRLRAGSLEELARLDGYTNHILGSRDLDLGWVVRLSGRDPPLIILPTRDRNSISMISFQDANPRIVRQWSVNARIDGLRIEDGSRVRLSTSSGVRLIDLVK
ncbi:MAG: FG-GAP repeat-containing [Beijerinckiaceae bacterium]|nr:MAG: FG-GAP repeat-containing [Beijerinckiaceae bacterium]